MQCTLYCVCQWPHIVHLMHKKESLRFSGIYGKSLRDHIIWATRAKIYSNMSTVRTDTSFLATSKEPHCTNVTGDAGVPATQLQKCNFRQMLRLRASQKEAGAFRTLSPKCQLLWDIVNQFPATGNDETALNKVVFPVLPPWLAFPHHVCENKASATALFSRSILLTDANRKMRGACKCAVTLKEQL